MFRILGGGRAWVEGFFRPTHAVGAFGAKEVSSVEDIYLKGVTRQFALVADFAVDRFSIRLRLVGPAENPVEAESAEL